MQLCPHVVFLSKKTFSSEMLLDLIKKTKQTCVLLVLAECVFVTTIFGLWMSKGAHDVFALVLNFLEKKLDV